MLLFCVRHGPYFSANLCHFDPRTCLYTIITGDGYKAYILLDVAACLHSGHSVMQ